MEINYKEFQESIAIEFKAKKNRVRNLIGGAHWGEDGRYKEVILMNYLKGILPNDVSVGTGFVKFDNEVSTQLDIIIYNNNIPPYFKEGDFVVVMPQSVYGIIEVKTSVRSNQIIDLFEKASRAGRLIEASKDKRIFNGVFIYDMKQDIKSDSKLYENIKEYVSYDNDFVNNLAFGDKIYTRRWDISNLYNLEYKKTEYAFYKLGKNTFGYFISNLLHSILYQKGIMVDAEYNQFLFSEPNGKESKRMYRLDICLGDNGIENPDEYCEVRG